MLLAKICSKIFFLHLANAGCMWAGSVCWTAALSVLVVLVVLVVLEVIVVLGVQYVSTNDRHNRTSTTVI